MPHVWSALMFDQNFSHGCSCSAKHCFSIFGYYLAICGKMFVFQKDVLVRKFSEEIKLGKKVKIEIMGIFKEIVTNIESSSTNWAY